MEASELNKALKRGTEDPKLSILRMDLAPIPPCGDYPGTNSLSDARGPHSTPHTDTDGFWQAFPLNESHHNLYASHHTGE